MRWDVTHREVWVRFGLVLAALAASGGSGVAAQDSRPVRAIPAAVDYTPEFDRALERGWRSPDGAPGHSYWQNWLQQIT